jgi:microcystin-dependent protein
MALESATYIDGLNTSNPTATDNISEADDHLRLVKSAIKTTFPNITGAVNSTHTELNLLDGLVATDIVMPTGSIIVYAGSSAPTGFLFCDGSAISRTTYATLFGVLSTTYGAGDSSSTFNIPDIRGRVIAGKEASASLLTSALGGLNGNTLGNTGGVQGVTLTSAQSGLPAHNHSLTMNSHTHTFTGIAHTHTVIGITGSGLGSGATAGGGQVTTDPTTAGGTNSTVTTTGTIANNSASDASSAHANVQPTIILNYCIKT